MKPERVGVFLGWQQIGGRWLARCLGENRRFLFIVAEDVMMFRKARAPKIRQQNVQTDMHVKRTKLGGRSYGARHTRLKNDWGQCDPPTKAGKEIRLDLGMTEARELDTIIHEGLHACGWEVLDEAWVERTASELSRLILKLGYGRKVA